MSRPSNNSVSLAGASKAFRSLALTALIGVFILVTVGGIVRVTGSGLGCPDWPLCHGKIIPPLDGPTLIEYSHRLAAFAVSILVIAMAAFAWRSYRKAKALLLSTSTALFLLVFQVILGGITVLKELPGEIVLAHLAVAQALVASIAVSYVLSRPKSKPTPQLEGRQIGSRFSGPLILSSAIVVYGILISGSYVMVSGASGACGSDWPLCQGQLLPSSLPALVHVAHRYLVLLGGGLILGVLGITWRDRRLRPELAGLSLVTASLFLSQVLVGALTLWLGFPMFARAIHLSLATAIWIHMVLMATRLYFKAAPGVTPAGNDVKPSPVLERATS